MKLSVSRIVGRLIGWLMILFINVHTFSGLDVVQHKALRDAPDIQCIIHFQ